MSHYLIKSLGYPLSQCISYFYVPYNVKYLRPYLSYGEQDFHLSHT